MKSKCSLKLKLVLQLFLNIQSIVLGDKQRCTIKVFDNVEIVEILRKCLFCLLNLCVNLFKDWGVISLPFLMDYFPCIQFYGCTIFFGPINQPRSGKFSVNCYQLIMKL